MKRRDGLQEWLPRERGWIRKRKGTFQHKRK